MKVRRAAAKDLPQLRQLWMTCFGDEESYVNRFFSFFSPQNAAVVCDGERLCAMALWLPVTYVQPDGDEQSGAYLYAVCTEPSCRGRGYCRAVCTCAEQLLKEAGFDFVFLRPADDGLASMYEKLGYVLSLTNSETQIEAQLQPDTDIRALAPEAYFQYRQLLLTDSFIDWPLPAVQYAAALGELLCMEKENRLAIAAVERYGQTVCIKEFLGDSALTAAIPSRYGVPSAVCRGRGETPFAMTKALTGKTLPTGYPGFVFD